MFFICDGNHRFKAWTGYIDRLHRNDRKWHYIVDNICLDTKGKVALFMNAMHDINKSNEHSHVKISMVYTLYRVKSVGCMPLESLKIWLTEEEYRRCTNSPHFEKTWYPLTTDVFRIGEASDDTAGKYYDETPKEEWSDPGVTGAMRAAAKTKYANFKGQFFKYLSIANPKFGEKFLEELEEGAVDLFTKTVQDDGLAVDMDVAQKPRPISQYIQAWHNQIWEMGFVGFFRGKESYTKTKAFKDQKQTDIAVKRVIYRYFKKELLALGAIEKANLLQYLSSWVVKNSPMCMYSVFLLRCWSIAHLRACCWYIECEKTFCPVEEEDARKLVIERTLRLLTKMSCKRMWWRWTSLCFSRRRRTRFSRMRRRPRLRLIRRLRRARRSRTRQKSQVGD